MRNKILLLTALTFPLAQCSKDVSHKNQNASADSQSAQQPSESDANKNGVSEEVKLTKLTDHGDGFLTEEALVMMDVAEGSQVRIFALKDGILVAEDVIEKAGEPKKISIIGAMGDVIEWSNSLNNMTIITRLGDHAPLGQMINFKSKT